MACEFNGMDVQAVKIGDDIYRGDEMLRIEAPRKGFPAWFFVIDNMGEVSHLIVAHQSIEIKGTPLAVDEEVDEEIPDENEY